MDGLISLIILISLITIGFIAGSYAERKHYDSIIKREKDFAQRPVISLDKTVPQREIEKTWMVTGNVVVSIDYFKRIASGLRNLVGGNMRSYESLLDRGRREAILRMQDMADDADMILNLRVETSSISNTTQNDAVGSVEVFAYGTAVKFKSS